MGKKRSPVWLAALIIAVAVIPTLACAAGQKTGVGSDLGPVAPAPTAAPTVTPMAAPTPSPSIQLMGDGATTAQAPADRMIIRTGNMTIVVQDVAGSVDTIARLAGTFSGFVVSSRIWEEGRRIIGVISLRVAPQFFDDTVKAVRDLAVQVTSESSTSQDVTEEFVDLESRLRNLEATRDQILKFLEKAVKVDEALSVQRELTNVQGDIEQTRGRMQALQARSSTSLIEVRLEQSRLDVDFSASRAKANVREELFFVSQVAGGFTPYSYEWSFGDGVTSAERNPAHIYKVAGTYSVSLTVTDDKRNAATQTRSEYVTVVVPPIPPGWSPGDTLRGAWNGLVDFSHVLFTLAVWAGVLAVIWLPVLAVVLWRLRAKRSRTVI